MFHMTLKSLVWTDVRTLIHNPYTPSLYTPYLLFSPCLFPFYLLFFPASIALTNLYLSLTPPLSIIFSLMFLTDD